VASLSGFAGAGGVLQEKTLLLVAALVSTLVPSAHELRDRMLTPRPAFAIAAAVLAVFCVLEVGRGAPVNFIYFQF
jgi:hypothetical protein